METLSEDFFASDQFFVKSGEKLLSEASSTLKRIIKWALLCTFQPFIFMQMQIWDFFKLPPKVHF